MIKYNSWLTFELKWSNKEKNNMNNSYYLYITNIIIFLIKVDITTEINN